MPTVDFLPFAVGAGANVEAQADYAAETALLASGFVAGVAPSAKFNKALRQSSIMATVLACFISDISNASSIDDGSTATLVANMKAAFSAAGLFSTPAQFDSTTKAATTAFVQRALGNFRGMLNLTANTTLTAAHCGMLMPITGGPFTITLPLASTMSSGAKLTFYAQGPLATIQRQGADTLGLGANFGTSCSIGGSDWVEITCYNSVTWVVTSGSVLFENASTNGVFGALVEAAGWQRHPSGLIIQQGSWVSNETTGLPVSVTFPRSFSTSAYAICVSNSAGSNSSSPAWYDTLTTTGFNGRATAAGAPCSFIAIGK